MYKIICITILLLTSSVSSQQLLSLEEAISYGLEHNYNIKIYKNENSIAQKNRGKGLAGFLPTIDLSGSAISIDNETETDTSLVNMDIENIGGEIKLNWTLFDGFRMFANNKMYKELAELSSYQTKDKIEQTIVTIAQAYFNVIQQEKLLQASLKSNEISEARLEREKTRNQLGGASSTDFYKAQVAYNTDKSNLVRQQTNSQLAYEQLNILLGKEPSEKYKVDTEIKLRDLQLTYDNILEKALQSNSQLKSSEILTKIAQRKVQTAKSTFLPRLGLVAGYAVNDQSRTTKIGSFTSPEFSTNTNDATVGLVLSYNLFNGRQDKINLDNAKIEKKNQELAYRDALNKLKGYVSEVFTKYIQQKQIVDLEIENVAAANQSLKLQQERNKLGIATSLDFRDAQLSLYRAETSLISAQFQTAVFRLEIERIIGILSK